MDYGKDNIQNVYVCMIFNNDKYPFPKSLNIALFCPITTSKLFISLRRVWRFQRGNQKPYIEEEHTTQWPKEKVQEDKNDLQNIHIKLKIELMCSGRVSSFCSTSGTRRVNPVTNPMIIHDMNPPFANYTNWQLNVQNQTCL